MPRYRMIDTCYLFIIRIWFLINKIFYKIKNLKPPPLAVVQIYFNSYMMQKILHMYGKTLKPTLKILCFTNFETHLSDYY